MLNAVEKHARSPEEQKSRKLAEEESRKAVEQAITDGEDEISIKIDVSMYDYGLLFDSARSLTVQKWFRKLGSDTEDGEPGPDICAKVKWNPTQYPRAGVLVPLSGDVHQAGRGDVWNT